MRNKSEQISFIGNVNKGEFMEDAITMETAWQQFDTLPAEAKREVIDFITFLQIRYQRPTSFKKTQSLKLSEEPFVGIWQDREDLSDSVSWVRDIRRREWKD